MAINWVQTMKNILLVPRLAYADYTPGINYSPENITPAFISLQCSLVGIIEKANEYSDIFARLHLAYRKKKDVPDSHSHCVCAKVEIQVVDYFPLKLLWDISQCSNSIQYILYMRSHARQTISGGIFSCCFMQLCRVIGKELGLPE